MSGPKCCSCVILVVLILTTGCARARIPTGDRPSPPDTPSVITIVSAVAVPSETPVPTMPLTATPEVVLPIPTLLPSPTSTAIQNYILYDKSPLGIIIQADVRTGPVTVSRSGHVPLFRLYGDGLVVYAGEPAPGSTGFDSTVMTGYLSEFQIQSLLVFLNDSGFYQLGSFYEPKPVPANLAKAVISAYVGKVKTVRVNGPGFPGTPNSFLDILSRITQTRPIEPKQFLPSDGYLIAVSAGSASDLRLSAGAPEWQSGIGVRLADATDGTTVSGTVYANVLSFLAKNAAATVMREGNRLYSVRFAPNLPRSVHLTDWIGTILDAPREFEGRVFDLVGYYRGANLLGEARGSPTGRSDWVIADDGGAMFVSGVAPSGLDPTLRSDTWTVVRLRASVVYVRNGTSYFEARRVEVLANKLY